MRRRRVIGWTALVLLVGLVVGSMVGGYRWLYSKAQWLEQFGPVARTLPAELAGARREGLPLEPADLLRNPPVPDPENAAPLYVQIDRAWQALPKSEQEDDKGITDFLRPDATDAARVKARAILARRAPQIALAEQAALLPHCDFHRPWEQGPNMAFPEYSAGRQIVRLLAARAILQHEGGRPLEALHTLHLAAAVSRQMGEEPMVIATLVQIALRAITDRALVRIMLANQDRQEVLAGSERLISELDAPIDIEHAFRGEVVICRVSTDIVRHDEQRSIVVAALRTKSQSRQLRATMCDAWEARMIAYWRSAFAAVRRTRGEPLDRYLQLKPLGDQMKALDGKATYELAAVVMPVFSQAQLAVVAERALAALRHATVEIVRFRQRSGRFPTTLAELPTAPPPDPFTGKPLIYRRTDRGFIVYSVGDNFKDDGGRTKARDKSEHSPPDFVVQYPPA